MGAIINAYRTLAGKPEEKRRIVRPRHRWKIILEWILGNRMGMYGLESSGSG
jgi:hypothetical protein